ncbi:MAG: hypothetical protein ACRCXB_00055 [Aeromonadaceae bacterium]
MEIQIPMWLLWAVGVPVGIAFLALAGVGIAFIISFMSVGRR